MSCAGMVRDAQRKSLHAPQRHRGDLVRVRTTVRIRVRVALRVKVRFRIT